MVSSNAGRGRHRHGKGMPRRRCNIAVRGLGELVPGQGALQAVERPSGDEGRAGGADARVAGAGMSLALNGQFTLHVERRTHGDVMVPNRFTDSAIYDFTTV